MGDPRQPWHQTAWYAAAWVLIAIVIVCIALTCVGCGHDYAKSQPPGDPLPPPARVLMSQESQYVYGVQTGGACARVSEEEAERALRAADEFINRKGVRCVLHEGSK